MSDTLQQPSAYAIKQICRPRRQVCPSGRRPIASLVHSQAAFSSRLQKESGSSTSSSQAGNGLASAGDDDGNRGGASGGLDLAVTNLSDLGTTGRDTSLGLAVSVRHRGGSGLSSALSLGVAAARAGADAAVAASTVVLAVLEADTYMTEPLESVKPSSNHVLNIPSKGTQVGCAVAVDEAMDMVPVSVLGLRQREPAQMPPSQQVP